MKQQKKNRRHQLKKSVITGVIFACIGMVILIAGFSVYQKLQKEVRIKEDTFTFSYGQPLPTNSDYYFAYGDAYEDEELDSTFFQIEQVGEYEIPITFAQKNYVLHIEIIDDQAPVITFQSDTKAEIYQFENEILWDTLFLIEDTSEYTFETTPSIEDMQDGSQTFCVVAKDIYGNESEACQTMELHLVSMSFAQVPQAASIEALVNQYIQEHQLTPATFGFFYHSPSDDETYVYNGSMTWNAASTIKIPLNMIYYDRYATGTLSPNDTVVLTSNEVEEGAGRTLIDNKLNQHIPFSYLQEQSIVNSDNTATNLLIKGLGGFSTFRQELPQYSDAILPSSFYSQNVVTMEYMLDVMQHLYEHRDHYQELISYMKDASDGEYLKASTSQIPIAQKYGLYEDNLHAVGIVYTPKPYIVGIYTNNRSDAERIISELNEWLIAYQLRK